MGNNADSFPWPHEAVAMLRRYWADNASASYIAGRISAEFKAVVTRNAVIGKVHRLGLPKPAADVRRARAVSGRVNGKQNKHHARVPFHSRADSQKGVRARKSKAVIAREEKRLDDGIQSEPPRPAAWTPKDIKRTTKPPIPAVHVSAITGAIIPGPDPLPPTPVASPDPRSPTDNAITLMDITSKNCCWPVTDGKPEWLFCGDERDPDSGKGGDRGYCIKHHRWSVSSGLGRKRADVCVGVE